MVNINSHLQMDASAIYEGETKNGLYHGSGRLIWDNGNTYVGEFAKGLPEGQGTFSFPNGDGYVGHFRHGRPDGTGRLTMDDCIYEGEFLEGEAYGQGRKSSIIGVYEGDFVYGIYHGTGKFTWANGDVYEGSFSRDKPLGPGMFSKASNDELYDGVWEFDDEHTWICKTYDGQIAVFRNNIEGCWILDDKRSEEINSAKQQYSKLVAEEIAAIGAREIRSRRWRALAVQMHGTAMITLFVALAFMFNLLQLMVVVFFIGMQTLFFYRVYTRETKGGFFSMLLIVLWSLSLFGFVLSTYLHPIEILVFGLYTASGASAAIIAYLSPR